MAEDADYDYPVGKARPLFTTWLGSGDKVATQPSMSSSVYSYANPSPKASKKTIPHKHYHSLDRRPSQQQHYQSFLTPLSPYSFLTPLNTTTPESTQNKKSDLFTSFSGTLDNCEEPEMSILEQVPPLPKSASNSTGNLYYSQPKNIPVDKNLAQSFYINQSQIQQQNRSIYLQDRLSQQFPLAQQSPYLTSSSSHLSLGPHLAAQHGFRSQIPQLATTSRPAVPPKSNAVLHRMHQPGSVTSLGSLGTPISPNSGSGIPKFPSTTQTLSRHTTAKNLPPLPVKRSSSSCSAKTPPISPNYAYPPVNPRPVVVGVTLAKPDNSAHLASPLGISQSKSTSGSALYSVPKPSNKPVILRRQSATTTDAVKPVPVSIPKVPVVPIVQNPLKNIQNIPNVDDDDDDDQDEDYAYDYVCLESRKKLNDEDENVKNILKDVNIQEKYEQLALDSCETEAKNHLESLQKSFQNLNVKNRAMINNFVTSYRRFFDIAAKQFLSWNSLTLQLIRSPHPPNVCINFTKHILLSGQNILLVVRSFNRHCTESNRNEEFNNDFIEALRQIVVQTKRFAGEYPSPILREDLERAIDQVKGLINRFQLEF